MKRIIIILTLILTIVFAGIQFVAYNNSLAYSKKPVLSIDNHGSELNVDVGGLASVEIYLKNSGNADLVISDITTSCGCIAPFSESLTIKAGMEGLIPLTFRDISGTGKRTYDVIANTNDPENPIFKYEITANVRDQISFAADPNGSFVLMVTDQSAINRIGACSIRTEQEWVLAHYNVSNGEVRGELLLAERAPEGYFDAQIHFDLLLGDDKLQKIVSYSLYKPSEKFRTIRPFTTGSYKNGVLRQEIKIQGSNLLDFNVAYDGSDLFDSSVKIKDFETVVLELTPLQSKHGYTERGHIFLIDKISNLPVFSHPVYLKY